MEFTGIYYYYYIYSIDSCLIMHVSLLWSIQPASQNRTIKFDFLSIIIIIIISLILFVRPQYLYTHTHRETMACTCSCEYYLVHVTISQAKET